MFLFFCVYMMLRRTTFLLLVWMGALGWIWWVGQGHMAGRQAATGRCVMNDTMNHCLYYIGPAAKRAGGLEYKQYTVVRAGEISSATSFLVFLFLRPHELWA